MLLVGFLGLVFSVPSQKIGWEEHLQSKLFGVEWDVKLCLQCFDAVGWAAGRASGL